MNRPTWLDALVGTELRDAHDVVVHFPTEAPLSTGDLVLETDRGWLQLMSVAPDRQLRSMRTPSDVKLIGDWSDRSGVVLATTHGVDVPFRIVRVDYAQRGDASPGATIGAWLIGQGSTVRRSLLLEPEDATIGDAERLWAHLKKIAPAEHEVLLFGGS